VPATTFLAPVYPNPFNGSAVVRFSISRAGPVRLAIYNTLGQRVVVLAAGEQEAGVHVLRWDGRDDRGAPVASGVYLCRLQTGEREQTRKLLLLR
jgi:flagellar hook assembly protein FlgD